MRKSSGSGSGGTERCDDPGESSRLLHFAHGDQDHGARWTYNLDRVHHVCDGQREFLVPFWVARAVFNT
jgi:hypothetical protein